ncbi:MAG: hypothetical protein O2798_03515 [Chloroflexi bacterium]|nr:hypothetical protein [Chloroflexota bacterium]MDA1239893.1 hypothetical protein [Chloroflexota bacterium]
MRIAVALLAAATLGGVAVADAQEAQEAPPMTVGASFRPAAVTVGDRVTLTVRVTHPDDVVISVLRPDFPGVELIASGIPREEPQTDGTIVAVMEWTLQPFTLRALDTGPVPVRWLRDDGTIGVFEGPAARLDIIPTRDPSDAALRPLKPQAIVEGAPPAWIRPAAIAGSAAGALILLGALAWWAIARRRRPVAVIAVEHGPEERARAQLDGVRGLGLEEDAAFQRYYGTISLAVRNYLGERFGFNAAALTTRELEQRMTRHGIDRWQARLVGGLLDRCDSAVYARRYPDPESADHDLTLAFEIVELGRPVEATVPEDEAVPA